MKPLILIIFFSMFCCYNTDAQTVSSQKNAKVSESVKTETATAPTTATIISGSRNTEVVEIPVEGKTEAVPLPTNTEATTTQRKPK